MGMGATIGLPPKPAWGFAPNPSKELRSLHPFFASRRLKVGLVISTKNRPENSGRQKGLAIRFRTLLSGELLTQFGFKHALTHTQALRGDLQQLIVVDELQALFQR